MLVAAIRATSFSRTFGSSSMADPTFIVTPAACRGSSTAPDSGRAACPDGGQAPRRGTWTGVASSTAALSCGGRGDGRVDNQPNQA